MPISPIMLKAVSFKCTLRRGWTCKFPWVSSNDILFSCKQTIQTESYYTKPREIYKSTPLRRVHLNETRIVPDMTLNKVTLTLIVQP